MHLGFDTESTHLIDFDLDLMDVSQPRITQIAAVLADDGGKIHHQMKYLIKPDGWKISEEATAKTGITTELCEQYGLPIANVLPMFLAMKKRCRVRVAHNISFDKRMVARETNLLGIEHNSEGLVDFCTMRESTNIVQLPKPSGKGGYKWPTLSEAYLYFEGKPLEGAHDALADVMACMAIYFKMRELSPAAEA